MQSVQKQDVVLSGGVGTSTNSARAGLLPISLERAPLGAFTGIAVYLRGKPAKGNEEAFNLYCSDRVEFTESHRERLREHNVQFIYIKMADQARFREQVESSLLGTVEDPTVSVSVKSELIYETSVELMNELLSEPDMLVQSPRLEKVSRAVTTLTLNDPDAFSHLFAASHHDFYTATHMVNVATWMVPLAYELGIRNTAELNTICQAGILHDVGKCYIPADLLNKKGKLSDEEWALIRRHPQMGCEHLAKFRGIHPTINTVTLQHHERLDGTGYPNRLKGDQIDMVSRICAVIDSFDAMTAFRPFKERTLSVAQALGIITKETPDKYDQTVVNAWLSLLRKAEGSGVLGESITPKGPTEIVHREYPRFPVDCPTRVHLLERVEAAESEWREQPAIPATAHNVSRSGIGLLAQTPIRHGETVRVYLCGGGSLNRQHDGVTMRCRAYKDGWFEIGVKFAELASEQAPAAVAAA